VKQIDYDSGFKKSTHFIMHPLKKLFLILILEQISVGPELLKRLKMGCLRSGNTQILKTPISFWALEGME